MVLKFNLSSTLFDSNRYIDHADICAVFEQMHFSIAGHGNQYRGGKELSAFTHVLH